MDGENFRAFVYGRRLAQTTKYDLPIHGVAVDGKLALHSSPVRQLEPGEVQARGLDAQRHQRVPFVLIWIGRVFALPNPVCPVGTLRLVGAGGSWRSAPRADRSGRDGRLP